MQFKSSIKNSLSHIQKSLSNLSESLTGFVFVIILACTEVDTARARIIGGCIRNAPREVRHRKLGYMEDLILKPAPEDLPLSPRKRFDIPHLNAAFLPKGEERVIVLN
ncbi:MAG: hypothetical protein R8P61_04715 [Bacteroidia bacterium]|nr:hypothetical protein [Bacteroidia bacterium]